MYLLLVHLLILRFIACWLKVVIMEYTRHKNGNYLLILTSLKNVNVIQRLYGIRLTFYNLVAYVKNAYFLLVVWYQ